jgi:phosphohistidine swiveling domain-containing protein
MKLNYIIPLSDPDATLDLVGGKGASLAKLIVAGLPVPEGFHVTTAAYQRFVEENSLQSPLMEALEGVDLSQPSTLESVSERIEELFAHSQIPPDVANAIVQAYSTLPGAGPAVAVRSSATAEDLPEASFAGQQETYLNVSGAGAVLEATRKCWASLWTARAIGYRARQAISSEAVALAVVVQLLVPAEVAGIMFTANPINGKRDEVAISAAWGLGEAVVGGKVTPDDLIVEKKSGRVLSRETASKEVMTVRVNGGTEDQPVPENLRQVPVLDDEMAAELARLGTQIEDLFEMPMDIEWALADGRFAIVQARPITALPEPEKTLQEQWPMPDPKGQYMRASIIDLMPDPLSPLFATMGLSTINHGISVMSEDMFNLPAGTFLNLTLTINGYAYQEVSFSARQWWLMLTRMVPAFPRMLREGVSYWRDVAHPQYLETTDCWREKSLPDLSPAELLAGVNDLLAAFSQHLGSLMASTMGPSAGSEMLFTNVYEKLVKREGDPAAPTFLMGFDSIPIKGEKALYDLALWCQEHAALVAYLTSAPADQIAGQLNRDEPPESVASELWQEFQARFHDYLDRYGYSIYDMDFAKPLPMDDPAPLLEILELFIKAQGKSPYERQYAYAERREQAVKTIRARLRGIRRWAFEKTLKWAQSQAPLREDGIAEIGLGYPVLRQMLRELGRRFAEMGAIQQADDIFWLERSEVEALVRDLERDKPLEDLTASVQERKALWRARKALTPPPQLPPGKKYMGFDMEAVLAGGEGAAEGNAIKGVAASPGKITGTARVVHGPEDFDQMRPGDVLVASITTPAWTPLFAMASAVVTDVGGPLSHGSIVAREYGIPAVLGTAVATKLVRNGQTITVDGSTGVVTLNNHS